MFACHASPTLMSYQSDERVLQGAPLSWMVKRRGAVEGRAPRNRACASTLSAMKNGIIANRFTKGQFPIISLYKSTKFRRQYIAGYQEKNRQTVSR